ncbi:MAG: hypothetical protein JSS81_10970 [Acidobacteria bacterium]|nr:hypothetical protein [Acidobacteriota bacterium]
MGKENQPGETGLRYLREIAALLIAAVVLVGFVVMMRETFGLVGAGREADFRQAKDLLEIFTGFLGIVIGYYFNRVTSETRAEKAESAARTASETARGAVEAHQETARESKAARETADAAKKELRNLVRAAGALLRDADPSAARGAALVESAVDEHESLRAALERAERFLE